MMCWCLEQHHPRSSQQHLSAQRHQLCSLCCHLSMWRVSRSDRRASGREHDSRQMCVMETRHDTRYMIHHASHTTSYHTHLHRASYILHHTSCIMHHTAYISYIIHHTSYSMQHTAYIIQHTSRTRQATGTST